MRDCRIVFLKTAPRLSSETPAGATSRDDAIFSGPGESLLQELKSPWQLILIPNQFQKLEVVEFRPAD